MRRIRALSDRLVGLVVPTVTAQGIWVDQYRCTSRCSPTTVVRQHRRCHDGSGSCTPWVTQGCIC